MMFSRTNVVVDAAFDCNVNVVDTNDTTDNCGKVCGNDIKAMADVTVGSCDDKAKCCQDDDKVVVLNEESHERFCEQNGVLDTDVVGWTGHSHNARPSLDDAENGEDEVAVCARLS